MITDTQIRNIVSEVLQGRFAEHGFVNSDVVFDEDFDGEKIIRVTAHFDGPRDVADSLFDAADDIRARLLETGDDRYVFVSRDYPGSADDGEPAEETKRTQTS